MIANFLIFTFSSWSRRGNRARGSGWLTATIDTKYNKLFGQADVRRVSALTKGFNAAPVWPLLGQIKGCNFELVL